MTETRKPTPEAKAREIERAAMQELRNAINRQPHGYKARLARRLGWDRARLHKVINSASPALSQVMAVAIAAGVSLPQLLQTVAMH